MGEVDIDSICDIIKNCESKLKQFIGRIRQLNESEHIFFIILLSQYLYARYCDRGKLRGSKYYIVPYDVDTALNGTGLSSAAVNLIYLRNSICHNYGSENMNTMWDQYIADVDTIEDLLKYLFSDSEDNTSNNSGQISCEDILKEGIGNMNLK